MADANNTWTSVLLVSLCLMLVHLQLALHFADITDCSGGYQLSFNSGSNLSLCCQLHQQDCNNTTLADTLTFMVPQKSTANYTMTRVNKCVVRLDVTNVSKQEEGHYNCCFKNYPQFGNAHVNINEELPPMEITNFSCNYKKTITVTFDPGLPSNDDVEINVTMIEWADVDPQLNPNSGLTSLMCEGKYTKDITRRTICNQTEGECVCQFPDTADGFIRNHNATIIVSALRGRSRFVSTNRTFSILDNFIPGPLTLDAVEVTTNEAISHMCADSNTQDGMNRSYEIGKPISYHVGVYKYEGSSEHLNVTIPDIHGWCLRIRLTNLTAFTNYTMFAFLSAGGGLGVEKGIDFTTDMTVPTHPPELDADSYLRCSTAGENGTPAIIIMWHPLPHDEKGGNNLSYIVQVMSLSGFNEYKTVTGTYAFFSSESLTTNLTVRIWAQNVEGSTENYSELNVPFINVAETGTATLHVEFDGNSAAVFVRLGDHQKVEELDVQWCQKHTEVSGVRICQEHPITGLITECIEETMQLEINLLTIPIHEIIEPTVVEYRLEESTPSIDAYKLANATLTTSRPYPQRFGNGDNVTKDIKPCSSEPGLSESIHGSFSEYTARRKRSLAPKFHGDGMNVPKRVARDTKVVDNTGDQYPLTFISLVTKDGIAHSHTRSGLIPADCYFDKQKSEAKVEASAVRLESGISVSWRQWCDKETREQFRADYFCLAESGDGNCQHECNSQRYNNTIGQLSTVTVSTTTNYICFHAYTNDNKYYAYKWPEGLGLQENKPTEIQTRVVAGVVSAIVAFVMCMIFAYCCYRRKKHFREILKGEVALIGVPQNPLPDVSANNPTEASEHSSSDSGRGSASDDIVARLGEDIQAVLEDQTLMLTTGSRHSETTVSSRLNSGHDARTTESDGVEEKVEQQEALKNTGLCFHSDASGHIQTSGEDDSQGRCDYSWSVVDSSGSNEHKGHVEEEEEEGVAQLKVFELAGLCFNCETSGSTQSSRKGDSRGRGDYSRSVVDSGGSNGKKELVEEEEGEGMAQLKAFEPAGLCFYCETSGSAQTSGEGDSHGHCGYSRSVVDSGGSNGKKELVEEEEEEGIAQLKALELAGLCFHCETSGSTQTSGEGGTDGSSGYSWGVLGGGGSN